MNKISAFFESFLGINWRTSLWGFISLGAAAIKFDPSLVDFLPDNIEKFLVGMSGFIAFLSGGAMITQVKDKSVTGGSVPSTPEAEKRIEKDEAAAKIEKDKKDAK